MIGREYKKCLYCTRHSRARKLCIKHYQSLMKYGDPLFTDRKKGLLGAEDALPIDWEKREEEIEQAEIQLCLNCTVVPDCVGITEKECLIYKKRKERED